MKPIPEIIPAIAPSRFMRLVKIPRRMTGKNDEAARPKASATTSATNPGGLIPSQPAMTTATPAAMRAAINSPFSLMSGRSPRLSRSWLTALDTTSRRPAAVESAAASPPAATRPTTQSGSPEISGFASTMMSRSTTSSFVIGAPAASTASGPTYWMRPSAFESVKVSSPVSSHCVNHSGTAA